MITNTKTKWSALVRQHRSIYRFGGPWAQAMLSTVPWLNAVVIGVLLLAVNRRLVVSPGVVFDLPGAVLREGSQASLTALMIAVDRGGRGGDQTLIFFDDQRYFTEDAEQMAVLGERLKNRVSLGVCKELLLLADKRVPHGDVMRFVNVARESGVLRVNVAEKPE